MIIGNNNQNPNNPLNELNKFNHKFKNLKEENQKNPNNNIFVEDISKTAHANPTSNYDMSNKSLSILNERLQQGLITMEEFNRQCQKIGQQRTSNNKNQ